MGFFHLKLTIRTHVRNTTTILDTNQLFRENDPHKSPLPMIQCSMILRQQIMQQSAETSLSHPTVMPQRPPACTHRRTPPEIRTGIAITIDHHQLLQSSLSGCA